MRPPRPNPAAKGRTSVRLHEADSTRSWESATSGTTPGPSAQPAVLERSATAHTDPRRRPGRSYLFGLSGLAAAHRTSTWSRAKLIARGLAAAVRDLRGLRARQRCSDKGVTSSATGVGPFKSIGRDAQVVTLPGPKQEHTAWCHEIDRAATSRR